ncbi:MAG: metal ABC transporter permease [Lachnospiraceae bacterium]|nr:metal ABC transporter permease [Lachnospiraceae bacterium]
MTEVLDKLQVLLQMDFVIRIIIVGILIAFCSSLLGVTLVLKRFSFIGDGLSHVAFGAMCIAMVLKFTNNNLLILPITVIAAVLMLKTGQNAKINGDAAIAMISVGSLAVGYLLLNMFPTSSNVSTDVCTTLFGSTSILTLSDFDVKLCIVMSIVVVAFYVFFYNKIFAITFDENFAKATGVRAGVYNVSMAVIIAIIIVLAMNLVGSLLVSALIIFPALSAMRIFKNFKAVVVCSAIFGVVCAVIGLFIAMIFDPPVGSTIVAVDLVGFLIFSAIGFITGRSRA